MGRRHARVVIAGPGTQGRRLCHVARQNANLRRACEGSVDRSYRNLGEAWTILDLRGLLEVARPEDHALTTRGWQKPECWRRCARLEVAERRLREVRFQRHH